MGVPVGDTDLIREVDCFGAVRYFDGDGLLNREDGPAVERSNGTREWWIDGVQHREDGPAVERANGDREWWIDGQRHREDGPACEWADGYREWYLDGKRLSEDEFEARKPAAHQG